MSDTDQPINDFALGRGGRFVGAILGKGRLRGADGTATGAAVERCYRTLLSDGVPLSRPAATYEFTNGSPSRVTLTGSNFGLFRVAFVDFRQALAGR